MITEHKNVAYWFLFLFASFIAFLGPFSTTFLNSYVVVVMFCIAILTLLVLAFSGQEIKLSRVMTPAALSYLSLMLIALFSIIYSRDVLTGEYLSSVIFGRVFTLITFVFTVFLLCWWLNYASVADVTHVLRICWFVLFIFMILGLYQFLCNIYGVKFFVETRDWMHGVPAVFKSMVPKRITSISEEPNFLAPLITEFILLTFILVRKRFSKFLFFSLGLFILIFSFSGGAYINIFLVALFFAFLSFTIRVVKGKISTYDILLSLFLIFAIVLFVYFGDIIFEFILYKFQSESSGGSSRSMFIKSLLKLYSDSDLYQMIFGHGLATMSVLDSFGLAKEEYLFRISNNFILDMLWESGIFGVMLVFTFYFSNFATGILKYYKNKYFFYGTIFSFHIFIVGLYRSEYLSSHFIFMILIIGMLYRVGYIKDNFIEK